MRNIGAGPLSERLLAFRTRGQGIGVGHHIDGGRRGLYSLGKPHYLARCKPDKSRSFQTTKVNR